MAVILRVVFLLTLSTGLHGMNKKQNTPPHCTQVTKGNSFIKQLLNLFQISVIESVMISIFDRLCYGRYQ